MNEHEGHRHNDGKDQPCKIADHIPMSAGVLYRQRKDRRQNDPYICEHCWKKQSDSHDGDGEDVNVYLL